MSDQQLEVAAIGEQRPSAPATARSRWRAPWLPPNTMTVRRSGLEAETRASLLGELGATMRRRPGSPRARDCRCVRCARARGSRPRASSKVMATRSSPTERAGGSPGPGSRSARAARSGRRARRAASDRRHAHVAADAHRPRRHRGRAGAHASIERSAITRGLAPRERDARARAARPRRRRTGSRPSGTSLASWPSRRPDERALGTVIAQPRVRQGERGEHVARPCRRRDHHVHAPSRRARRRASRRARRRRAAMLASTPDGRRA